MLAFVVNFGVCHDLSRFFTFAALLRRNPYIPDAITVKRHTLDLKMTARIIIWSRGTGLLTGIL